MVLRHEVRTHTYANGLTLLVETMPDVQSAAFSLMVPAGSIYDPPGANGAASALSDWIMRGAGALDSRQLTTALDNLGLQRNEGPGSSHLSFSGATLAENLPAALRIYADIVQRPHLPDEEFAAAQAGLEQSLKGLEDEPRQKIMIELRKRCYDAPWGLPTEGTLSEVQALTPEIVRRHYEQTVRPRDGILAVAGYVDADQMIELVGQLFGEMPDRAAPEYQTGPRGPQRDHLQHESTQTQIGIAYESVPYRHLDYYAAWAAVSVLSGGMSSRLFTEVREKRGLVYSVYASLNTLRDQGRVLCYAGTTRERAQETLDVLLSELQRLASGIEATELERCQARAKSSLIMQQESSGSRAASMARDWYHLGRVTTLDEVRQQIDALTVQSLLDHLARFPARDFTVLTLGSEPLEVRGAVS